MMTLTPCLLTEMSAYNTNYTLLELLIQNHKERSDRLETRITTGSAMTGSQMLKEDSSDKLKLKIDTLSMRYTGILQDLTLLFDAASVTMEAVEAVKVSNDAISYALSIADDHPEVLLKGYYLEQRVAQRISDIYKMVAHVATNGIKESLATKAQRKKLVLEIKSAISFITGNMRNFHYYCRVRSYCNLKGDTKGAIEHILKTDGLADMQAFENVIGRIKIFKL